MKYRSLAHMAEHKGHPVACRRPFLALTQGNVQCHMCGWAAPMTRRIAWRRWCEQHARWVCTLYDTLTLKRL